jgi:uncharacterized protein (TIGR02145 family)
VNPSGQVNQVEDITVNSGEIVNEIIFSTSNSSDATSYTWTINTSSLGLAASGSGNIPSFTAINTTTPIVGTITVTPMFSATPDCFGPSISFTVTVNPAADSITDQDGNTYDYLTYGDQVWTVENAEMVTYRDGTPIPQVTDNIEWKNLTTGAWAYYNNDPLKGKLYNWFAVIGIHDTDPNTPNKEFAPEGWHVPTDAEWTTLEEYLIASGYNYDGTTTENKIAKAMASNTGWNSSTYVGAVGNGQSSNNSSGFNAIPEGYRGYYEQGSFVNNGNQALFWSSSSSNEVLGWYFRLSYQFEYSDLTNDDSIWKQGGMQVRFVRD